MTDLKIMTLFGGLKVPSRVLKSGRKTRSATQLAKYLASMQRAPVQSLAPHKLDVAAS